MYYVMLIMLCIWIAFNILFISLWVDNNIEVKASKQHILNLSLLDIIIAFLAIPAIILIYILRGLGEMCNCLDSIKPFKKK